MFHLSSFVVVFMWMQAISTSRAKQSPILMDFSKVRQTYFAWPVNTPLSLKCKGDGEPPLTVSWYKNGKLMKSTPDIFQDQKWNLKFRKPQLSDNGVYTCVVSNHYGSVKHNYSLRVLPVSHSNSGLNVQEHERIRSEPGPPVLVPGYPRPVVARVGDNVQLECLEKPNGQVSHYRWLKTNSPVNKDQISPLDKDSVKWLSPQKYTSFEVDAEDNRKLNGVMLKLTHVTEEDTGYYTCSLSNSNGFTSGTAFLNVTSILPSDPPEFLVPKHKRQHFIAAMEKEDVTFSCLVRGGAPLKYQWFYNGRLMKSDEAHEIRESELVVRHVKQSDNGRYTCRIKNDYGHIKHGFRLKVLTREPLYPDHPVLQPGFPKNKTATLGDSASFFCADMSDSLVDYRWLKWNKSVTTFTKDDLRKETLFTILHPKHYEQRAHSKRGVYLKLKNLTFADEGLYTCLAVSMRMGFSYRSAFLKVKQPAKDRYDQKVPADLVKIKTTLEEATTTMQQTTSTEKPIAGRRCFENKKHMPKHELYSTHVETQCETTAACASMYDERTSEHAMFCDEKKLCIKHNISSGECTEVKPGEILCCCVGDLCNQRQVKLFQKNKKTQGRSSTGISRLTSVIFFSTFVLTISLMLALLGYRLRQRKVALKEGILQTTRRSSHKMTKQKVMETRWMKEENV